MTLTEYRKKKAEYSRKYRAEHRENLNEYNRNYRKNNPDKVKQWEKNRIDRMIAEEEKLNEGAEVCQE